MGRWPGAGAVVAGQTGAVRAVAARRVGARQRRPPVGRQVGQGVGRELADRIAAIGPQADGSLSVEQIGAFLRAEHARWAEVTREIGVLPE